MVGMSPREARRFRSQVATVLALICALLVGGIMAYLYKHGVPGLTDAGATVMGAAFGAGLSVWGAYFASLISQRRRNVDFEEVTEEFVDNLTFEAWLLNSMCFEKSVYLYTAEDRAATLRAQGRMLDHAIEFFDYHVAAVREGDFDLRLRIAKLRNVVRRAKVGLNPQLEPEYLVHSYAVSSRNITQGCDEFWIRDLDRIERQSPHALTERIKQLQGR